MPRTGIKFDLWIPLEEKEKISHISNQMDISMSKIFRIGGMLYADYLKNRKNFSESYNTQLEKKFNELHSN